MELVPLIKTHKRQIVSDRALTEENILEKIGENGLLYVLDIDGIKKDKPNYCIYQKLSKSFDLWIDCGPRNLEDVVDSFMAGATRTPTTPDSSVGYVPYNVAVEETCKGL